MPLPDLLAALERDAEAQAETILAAARVEADRLTAETDARITAQRAAARATTESVRRGELERDLARARREAQARVLAARAGLIEKVERAIRGLLPEAIGQLSYLESLAPVLDEALGGVGDVPVEIRCSPRLETALRGLVTRRTNATVTADAGVGSGFRARAMDGSVEVDATLESRLARERPQLALAALALLEGGPENVGGAR